MALIDACVRGDNPANALNVYGRALQAQVLPLSCVSVAKTLCRTAEFAMMVLLFEIPQWRSTTLSFCSGYCSSHLSGCAGKSRQVLQHAGFISDVLAPAVHAQHCAVQRGHRCLQGRAAAGCAAGHEDLS